MHGGKKLRPKVWTRIIMGVILVPIGVPISALIFSVLSGVVFINAAERVIGRCEIPNQLVASWVLVRKILSDYFGSQHCGLYAG